MPGYVSLPGEKCSRGVKTIFMAKEENFSSLDLADLESSCPHTIASAQPCGKPRQGHTTGNFLNYMATPCFMASPNTQVYCHFLTAVRVIFYTNEPSVEKANEIQNPRNGGLLLSRGERGSILLMVSAQA